MTLSTPLPARSASARSASARSVPGIAPAPLALVRSGASTGMSAGRVRPDEVTARLTSAAALAAVLSARSSAWAERVEFRADSRWTALLDPAVAADLIDPALHADLATAQIWLLSWLPGQGTPLHDHGGSAGAFAVVAGELTERAVTRLAVSDAPEPDGVPSGRLRDVTTTLTTGRVRPFGPRHVHQVTNAGPVPAVSVHVYTSDLAEMNTYSVTGHGLLRTGTERAGVDW